MTSVAEQPNVFLAHFSNRKQAEPWLERLRESAIQRFAALGFPSTHDEEWRFTNVAPIAKVAFRTAGPGPKDVTAAQIDYLLFADPQACRLVFVNGRFAPALSSPGVLPKGVKAGSLAQALVDEPAVVEPHLACYAAFETQPFVALNTASFEDGAFIHVPKGTVVEKPIHIVFLSAGYDQPAVTHPRNLVLAERDSQFTLVESYIGTGTQI